MEIRRHMDSAKPAVILHPSRTELSFAELEARANRLAHYFRRCGLVEGDAIAAILENNEHTHAVMWAARRSGLYYAVINTHLSAAEAAYIIENSAAKAVIGSSATRAVCGGLGEHLPNGLPAVRLVADDRPRRLAVLPPCRRRRAANCITPPRSRHLTCSRRC